MSVHFDVEPAQKPIQRDHFRQNGCFKWFLYHSLYLKVILWSWSNIVEWNCIGKQPLVQILFDVPDLKWFPYSRKQVNCTCIYCALYFGGWIKIFRSNQIKYRKRRYKHPGRLLGTLLGGGGGWAFIKTIYLLGWYVCSSGSYSLTGGFESSTYIVCLSVCLSGMRVEYIFPDLKLG